MEDFTPESFRFLRELEHNNRRDWFEPRRAEFDALLVIPLAAVVVAASAELRTGPWPMSGSRATVFRQLRDQRYAKAQPYATAVRALLTSTGTKPAREGCVHVEVSSHGGFVGAGFHRPPSSIITPIRQRMAVEPDRWRNAVHALEVTGRALGDDRLVRMPRGFEALALHDLAADLRLRSIETSEQITVDDWLSGRAVERIVALVTAAMPILRFGNDAAGFAPAATARPVTPASASSRDGTPRIDDVE
jgi:uncharacterized protein (TIGR02453 family)